MLVGRLTRDPELRSLPSGKHVATFTVATNEFRGGAGERTEYHPCVAWDRLAEICGQFLSKGQLVDVEGRLQTRQWDDDATRSAQELAGRRDRGRSPVARRITWRRPLRGRSRPRHRRGAS
ncbi:MAG TPA: single-stranded DNA-binding protein [Candidatus Limnocylindria bacterium]